MTSRITISGVGATCLHPWCLVGSACGHLGSLCGEHNPPPTAFSEAEPLPSTHPWPSLSTYMPISCQEKAGLTQAPTYHSCLLIYPLPIINSFPQHGMRSHHRAPAWKQITLIYCHLLPPYHCSLSPPMPFLPHTPAFRPSPAPQAGHSACGPSLPLQAPTSSPCLTPQPASGRAAGQDHSSWHCQCSS